jgi:hypothetical protein
MCIAIPYGRQGRSGGTRLGRLLRTHPALALRIPGWLALALGLGLLALLPWADWPSAALPAIEGLAWLALAPLLQSLPERCAVSPPGYGRLAPLGGAALGGALLAAAAPGLGAAAGWGGLGLFVLAWRLAWTPLTRALRWCRGEPPPLARRLPLALVSLLASVVLLSADAFGGSTGAAAGGVALGLGALALLALAGRGPSGLAIPT